MSKTRKSPNPGGGRDRHISVRAVRRDPPDLRKLSRAVIQLAIAQAAAEAEAERAATTPAPAQHSDITKPEEKDEPRGQN